MTRLNNLSKTATVRSAFVSTCALMAFCALTAAASERGYKPEDSLNADDRLAQIASQLRTQDQQQREMNAQMQNQMRRNQWLRAQLAEMSREQREQMRFQIRAQRIQSQEPPPMLIRADPAPEAVIPQQNLQLQQLSPDERREFHQWMRERHEQGTRFERR